MIDPTAVSTIRVGELPSAPFNLTDNIPHEVGVDLKKGTIEELSTFISAYIGATDAVGFRAISVTDGQTLPTTTKEEFILVGKGTFYNVAGGSTIVCTEELNAIVSNGSFWFIGVEIPVNIELSGVTQFIRQGFIDTTPSEDVVYDALATKENIANKSDSYTVSSSTTYASTKALVDGLATKANDVNVIHTTGNETKTGNLNVVGVVGIKSTNPKGSFHVFTGTSGVDIDVAGQENGSISFSNSGASTASPCIVSKSNNAQGLTLLASTNDSNSLSDFVFDVRENDNTDFATNTNKAFTFRRYQTDLLNILRNGNSTFLGSVKGANFITNSGDYFAGLKSKTATATFYNSKIIIAHADYGFLENSDLNYASDAFQGHASFNDNINIIGIQNSDHHHSYQAYPHYSNTGLLDNLKGFWMQPDVTAGTVTNLFEFEANNPLGSGTITNLHGLHVRELTRGTNNYAIFTEGATPSIIGGTYLGGSKVGKGGTITPAAQLEVIDINKLAATGGNATIRSTDTAAIDKGGYLTLGGSYNGTSRTVFGGIAGRKENATNNNIAGYLSFTTTDASLGVTEKLRIASTGAATFSSSVTATSFNGSATLTGTPTAPTAAAGTNTTQLATTAFVQGIRPYKVYTALLTQVGTDAPTAIVLENTIGAIVWSRSVIGGYFATLSEVFTTDKTSVLITNGSANSTYIHGAQVSTSNVNVITPDDGQIDKATIEIRVYN